MKKEADLEKCIDFDSESVFELGKEQKEIDTMVHKIKTLEQEQSKSSNDLKSEILDLKSCSLCNNLIFHVIMAESGDNERQ